MNCTWNRCFKNGRDTKANAAGSRLDLIATALAVPTYITPHFGQFNFTDLIVLPSAVIVQPMQAYLRGGGSSRGVYRIVADILIHHKARS